MMFHVNLALMEVEKARRDAERHARRGVRPALDPMAEYRGDRQRRPDLDTDERSITVSLNGDEN